MNLTKHQKAISRNGYTIIQSFLSKSEVKKLLKLVELNFKRDSRKKNPTFKYIKNQDKGVFNLQYKDYSFIKLISQKRVENIAKYFLNDPYYQLLEPSKPNYILKYYNARSSVNKLNLHIDTYMPFGGKRTYMMQFIFLLNDSTSQNGCSFVVEGSHKSGKFCDLKSKKTKNLEAKAGDLIIWDSRLWHGARVNKSGEDRWALVASFSQWFIKQSMDMPKGLPKKIYNKCTRKEKLLLGFCSIPPVDEKHGVNTKAGYNKLT
jgi:ectoine hydroxylase-related dioxygenase (phytanoyl-CoA dioxygenase family)